MFVSGMWRRGLHTCHMRGWEKGWSLGGFAWQPVHVSQGTGSQQGNAKNTARCGKALQCHGKRSPKDCSGTRDWTNVCCSEVFSSSCCFPGSGLFLSLLLWLQPAFGGSALAGPCSPSPSWLILLHSGCLAGHRLIPELHVQPCPALPCLSWPLPVLPPCAPVLFPHFCLGRLPVLRPSSDPCCGLVPGLRREPGAVPAPRRPWSRT